MSSLHRLAERLRQEPGLSRNRNFDELSAPDVMRARRVLRRLAGLTRELAQGASVDVQRRPGGYLVTIEFPPLRARREAFLTDDEHALLLCDAALAPKLSPHAA